MSRPTAQQFFPFLSWAKTLNANTLRHDFLAGITGAIVVLPQGVAFAMIAGMPPIYGLYTAMIAPIIAGLFGSSHHMITGPATAISIVIYSSITQLGIFPDSNAFIGLVLTLTLLVGIMQLILGLARMGSVVNFVSHTVVIGFTAGAAILIATSQLKHALKISIPQGSSFYSTWNAAFHHLDQIHWPTFVVAFGTLGIAILTRVISKKLPHYLFAMIGGSLIALAYGGASSGLIMLEEIPSSLPPFAVPEVDFEKITFLSSKAFALALLGLIEAVAIGKSIASQSGQRINNNQEFIGQGLANLVGSFFSCHAGSGSFTRSGLNYQAGAKTPLAGIIAALLLMLIVLFIAPLTAYIPIPAMAGVIFLVAYNLIDVNHIKEIIKISGTESVVLIITFSATLFLELEFAIYAGVIFSLIFYLRKTSKPRIVTIGIKRISGVNRLINIKRKKNVHEIPGIKMIRIDGSLFFGSVDHVNRRITAIIKDSKGDLLVDCSGIDHLDMSGAELLVAAHNTLQNQDRNLILCNLKRRTREYLYGGKYAKQIGAEHIFETEWMAIDWVRDKMTPSVQSNWKAS